MDYKIKYIKYKNKYNNLKKELKDIHIGGNNFFNVVPNSGQVDDMSNQCMWISISDYLRIYREINISVRELRQIAGLDRTTEQTQFDWETPQFRRGIEKVAEIFGLRINCYLVGHDGVPNQYLFFDPDTKRNPMPMHIINERGHNIVNLAFYGAHFQLITSGFGLERFNGRFYKTEESKPIKTITFFENETIDVDPKIKKYYDQIIENEQLILALDKIITGLITDIELRQKNLEDLSSDIYEHIKEVTDREILEIQREIELHYETIKKCRDKIKEAHEKI